MKVIVPLLSILLTAGPFCAAETSSAEKLVAMFDFAAQGKQAAAVAFRPVIEKFRAQGLPDEAITEIQAAADSFFEKTFSDPAMRAGLIELYQQHFTSDELDELIRFYGTPVGRKSLQVLPVITNEGMQLGQKLAAKNQEEFQKQLTAIITKYKPAPKK